MKKRKILKRKPTKKSRVIVKKYKVWYDITESFEDVVEAISTYDAIDKIIEAQGVNRVSHFTVKELGTYDDEEL